MGCCYTDVFISYKAEDRAQLKPLVDALEAEGFAVWWDAHIGGGTNWHEDIEEHLNSAKCVIVAWSKRSISHDGHFVRDEARRAQRRGTYLAVDDRSISAPFGVASKDVGETALFGPQQCREHPFPANVALAVEKLLTKIGNVCSCNVFLHRTFPFRDSR